MRAAGRSSLWLAHGFELDALTALALVGRAVGDAGATDLVARLFGTDDDQRRTLEVLGQLHDGPRREQR